MKLSTTRLKFAWVASVSGACHVVLDKLPKSIINSTKSKVSPKRLLAEFIFFSFYSKQMSKCLLGDSPFGQSDAIKIKRKKDWWGIIKNVDREDGP